MLTGEQIERFMSAALSKVGADDMVTPREIIRDFLTLLNILRDNEGASFDDLLKNSSAVRAMSADVPVTEDAPAKSEKKSVTIFDIEI